MSSRIAAGGRRRRTPPQLNLDCIHHPPCIKHVRIPMGRLLIDVLARHCSKASQHSKPSTRGPSSIAQHKHFTVLPLLRREYSSTNMSNLSVELEAPNGRKWTQPTGLFINNEFVAAKSGKTITSIDPACVHLDYPSIFHQCTADSIQDRKGDRYCPCSRP